jgi:hypothetical protein
MTEFIGALVPAPDRLNRERIQRLRGALKVLGRGFALRCTNVSEAPGIPPPSNGDPARARASDDEQGGSAA